MATIVLGLPRSGTSLVAGLLGTLGVDMGARLMPPMAGVNDKGFFEDLSFVELNIAMLGAHYSPRICHPCPHPTVSAKYRDEIASREENSRKFGIPWGVKDPKFCFTLPYLLRYFTAPPTLVVTSRPFDESVASMLPLYGGLDPDTAAGLLGRYLYAKEKTLQAAAHLRRLEVPFHDVLASPGRWSDKLADLAGVKRQPWGVAEAFVERRLARHVQGNQQPA